MPARRNDSRGATLLEYGLIVAGVAGVVFLGALSFGEQLSGVFSNFINTVQNESHSGPINPDPIVSTTAKPSPKSTASPDPSPDPTDSLTTDAVPTGP